MPWDPLDSGHKGTKTKSHAHIHAEPLRLSWLSCLPSVSRQARGLSDSDKGAWWSKNMMSNQNTNQNSIRAKWTAAFCLELWNPISLREISWTPWDRFTQGHLRCKRCSHTFPCGSCGCLTSLRQHFRFPNTKSYWRKEFWTWEMDRNGSCSVLTRVWDKIVMSPYGRGILIECQNVHTSMFAISTIISPSWSLPS